MRVVFVLCVLCGVPNIGALIIRIGIYYTISIIRNPQNRILFIKAPTLATLLGDLGPGGGEVGLNRRGLVSGSCGLPGYPV